MDNSNSTLNNNIPNNSTLNNNIPNNNTLNNNIPNNSKPTIPNIIMDIITGTTEDMEITTSLPL